ncbi:MAG TPA: hypothetical protein VGE51_11815 [Fontimonas sp.]
MRPSRLLSAAFLCLAAAAAQASSYVELYQQVPVPPTDLASARSDAQDGKITAPELIGFRQTLEREKAAIAALNGGVYPEYSDEVPAMPSADAPEVLSAARAYASYLNFNSGDKAPAKAMAKRTRWVMRAKGQQHSALAKAGAQGTDYESRRDRLIDEELVLWDALYKDWKSTRSPLIGTAQPLLAATDFGAKAQSAEGRTLIARYRAAMLQEVELLFSLTELAVLRTDAFSRNAGDSMPDALSGATKKSKAP